jgi:hypothetical protein
MKPGLYWGKSKAVGDKWILVEVRDASYRPDEWYEPGEPKVEIFTMGWDCCEKPSVYSEFIPANLIDPDGKSYLGV